jgi:hypothetical protein
MAQVHPALPGASSMPCHKNTRARACLACQQVTSTCLLTQQMHPPPRAHPGAECHTYSCQQLIKQISTPHIRRLCLNITMSNLPPTANTTAVCPPTMQPTVWADCTISMQQKAFHEMCQRPLVSDTQSKAQSSSSSGHGPKGC